MKKVFYSVQKLGRFDNPKLTGLGYLTDEDLVIACISQKGKPYIRVFEGVREFCNTPTNISVLSHASIENKIRQLMLVLSAVPDLEITCTDSSECFDDNKAYLYNRMESEKNPKVKKMLKKDILFLDQIQMEMATARQFMFVARCRNMKPQQVFERANTISKVIGEQGFDCHRMKKDEIKRFLALYFDASMLGEHLPDYDGSQYFDIEKLKQEDDENG